MREKHDYDKNSSKAFAGVSLPALVLLGAFAGEPKEDQIKPNPDASHCSVTKEECRADVYFLPRELTTPWSASRGLPSLNLLDFDTEEPLVIDGIVRVVAFSFPKDLFPDAKACHYRDSYNNNIEVSFSIIGKPRVFVRVRVPSDSYGMSEEKKLPLHIDLSAAGLPYLDTLIKIIPPAPFFKGGSDRSIPFYTDADREQLYNSRFGLEMLSRGIEDAEQLLGKRALKRVLVVHADCNDAFVDEEVPTEFCITDHTLYGTMNKRWIGFHETVHIIDQAAGLSDGVFAAWFDRMKNRDDGFLESINEGVFLPGGIMGHAESNAKECLATFLNTWNHPEWKEVLSSEPRLFQSDYLEGLEALRDQAEQCGILNSSFGSRVAWYIEQLQLMLKG